MAAKRKSATKRKTAKRKSTTRTAARGRKTTTKTAKTSARRAHGGRAKKYWSQDVTEHSDAMDLKKGVFKQGSAKKIAQSVKNSAEKSTRKKSGSYRSALSMLTFYINRAGKTLPKAQRARLERAKDELRKAFGKE